MNKLTVLFAVLLASSAVTMAQIEKGTFAGTVFDATGAVLPGVKITITNMKTSEVRTAVTGDSGVYRVTNLPPGLYELKAELQGFKTVINSEVELTAGQTQRVDFRLEVGEITEVVTVTGEAPAVNTEEGRLSALIDSKRIVDMPLNGRNIFQLAQLQPGVVSVGGLGLQADDVSSFVAQGNRHRGTNYLLDGTDNNNPGIGGVPTLTPVQDAVQEFRLSTTNFPTEFGRNAGSVVNVVTKRGTNEFHGSAWEFHRNSALDAREFTDEKEVAPLIQNQFGFTFGGPIKRNHAWFFGYYEGQRVKSVETSSFQAEMPAFVAALANVPILAQTKGVQLLRRHPIIAPPSTASRTAADIVRAIRAEGEPTFGSGFSGHWFADWNGDGNVDARDIQAAATFWRRQVGVPISDAEVSLIAQRATALWNLLVSNPDLPVLGTSTFGPSQRSGSDQYSIRIDHEFNQGRDMLFGRWTQQKSNQNLNNINNVAVRSGITDPFEGSANNLAVVHTHVFSPRIINEFRFGWNKGRGDFFAVPHPLPEITITGPAGIPTIGAYSGFPQLFTEHTFQYWDNISINIGSHGIRTGVEFRRNQENGVFDVSSRGNFIVSGIGDFLLDQPNDLFLAYNPLVLSQSPPSCVSEGVGCRFEFPNFQRGFRNTEFGVYFQDDWKLTPRFTFNYGIRYDLYSVPKERFGRQSNLIFGQGANIFERVARAGRFDPLGTRTGRVQFNPDLVKDLYAGDHNNFSPRVGFAWDPFGTGRTSIRGGYGIGYDRIFFNVTSNVRFNPPLHAFGTWDLFIGNNVAEAYDIDVPENRFPKGIPLLGRISLRTPDPNLRITYTQNWFFGFQRELFKDLVVDINYVGSAGRKLSLIEDYNRFRGDRFRATDPFGLGRPADPGQTRLHPDFTTTGLRANMINSIYHSLQVQVNKKVAAGFGIQGAWTFSRLIDADSDVFALSSDPLGTMDPTNIGLERGLSSLDATNRLVVNGLWEIPWLKDQTSVIGKILGGWQVNAIAVMQSGRPFPVVIPDTVGNGDFAGGDRPNEPAFGNTLRNLSRSDYQRDVFGPAPCRPTITTTGSTVGSTATVDTRCGAGIFKGAVFTSILGENGTLGRNTFRGPGFANFDFSVFKNIRVRALGEEGRVQFRAEFFNLFNRVNLAPIPAISATSAFFGTIGSQFDAREIQFALKFIF